VQTYQEPAADAFAALGDGTRRAIFELLRDGPRAVGELAAFVPVSRPAVSQHLRVLKEAGLVSDEPVGNRRVYRVEPDALEELRSYFVDFWSDALTRFKTAAEAGKGGKR
jgi:DNA-binding transcriptional ArsR family regulator